MITIRHIITTLLVSYSLIFLVTLFNKKFLLPELFSMLLPYWLVLNLIILGAMLFFYQYKIFTKLSFLNISLSLLFIITLYLAVNFYKFSFLSFPDVQASTGSEVRVAFFNKLYSNTNYYEIDNKLKEVTPDFIGFSELKKEDISNIPYLQNYKYSQIKDARDNSTIAFFSNQPSELDTNLNLAYVLPLKMQLQSETYHVFVIHPMPPINSEWLSMRNQELTELSTYINSLNSENVILIGDFNLTPWSPIYQQFANNQTKVKNAAIGQGINFTWGNSLIKTQVDHIFIPKGWSVDSFKSEQVPGSDHNLIWIKASY